jgi:sugar phosphate isomerase/epimerase
MKRKSVIERLAVCSWSLQAETPEILAERIALTGVHKVQLALDPLHNSPDVWAKAPAVLAEHGISIVSGMVGCDGEDYTTLDTIRRTGGVAPDETWEKNRKDLVAKAEIASGMGLKLVTIHAGFLPHDHNDPIFAKMVHRLRDVADIFAAKHITLGFETGQETADALAQLLKALERPGVRVNFDPANMILYAKGDPIEALRVLAPWIAQVHVKDARATKVRGTWGEEVAVGSGEVNWNSFCATLNDINFTGNLVFEREAGNQRIADLRTARMVIEQAFASNEAAAAATSTSSTTA